MTKTPEALRSHRWFGRSRAEALRAFSHRSRMRQLGVLPEEHLGKPVIAILNTWSELNPCHMHLRERAGQVKRGVLEAGGYPVELPVATLSETSRPRRSPAAHSPLSAPVIRSRWTWPQGSSP